MSSSGFLDRTPTVQVVIENPLLRRAYPSAGAVTAIIDSGYQGFLCVPKQVFLQLGLNKLSNESREISLADGSFSRSKGCYATLVYPHLAMKIDGFVETFRGLDEVLVGVEALVQTRVVLDYCSGKVRIDKCNP